MDTKIVWANPQLRTAFNILLTLALMVTTWALIFAVIIGGVAWISFILCGFGDIVIVGIAELVHAYDEKIVSVEEDNDLADS